MRIQHSSVILPTQANPHNNAPNNAADCCSWRRTHKKTPTRDADGRLVVATIRAITCRGSPCR